MERGIGSSHERSPLGYRIPLISLKQAMAVAEHLNFRHAASALGISQSGLSQRIKQLEQELGVLLFERRHRGVVVTEAGEYFLRHVVLGIRQLDHAVKIAGVVATGGLGRLRICLSEVITSNALTDILERFRNSHPQIDIEIAERQRDQAIQLLRQGQLDIAFVAGAANVSDCHSKQLWLEPVVATLPAQHKLAQRQELAWADLSSETFLVRHEGVELQATERMLHRLGDHSFRPDVLRFDVGRDTLLRFVAEGYGIALAPESARLLAIPGVAFRRLDQEPADAIPFTAIWSPFNKSAPHRRFLDLMLRRCRDGETPVKP